MPGENLPAGGIVDGYDEVLGAGLVLEILPTPAVDAEKRQGTPYLPISIRRLLIGRQSAVVENVTLARSETRAAVARI
jgi:hypothetical protein